MNDTFTEFSEEILTQLKARGYKSVKILLKGDNKDDYRTIELVPSKSPDFQLDHIPLDSPEIKDYIDQQSPLVKYLIKRSYMPDNSSK